MSTNPSRVCYVYSGKGSHICRWHAMSGCWVYPPENVQLNDDALHDDAR